MIPWWRFVALVQLLPRLETAESLRVATGVAYGYLDARISKKDRERFRLDHALARARRFADGTEADG